MNSLFDISKLMEKSAVSTFLKNSENYKALEQINMTSKKCQKGALGQNSIFKVAYQIDFDMQNHIEKMLTAKTFKELFELTGVTIDKLNHQVAGYVMKFLGYFYQQANALDYMMGLANEIIDYTKKYNYPLEIDDQHFEEQLSLRHH